MPPARDLSMWPLHVISSRDPCTWPWCSSAHSRSWVDWTLLHNFAKKTTSLERQRSVVSARDVSCDFFRSRWASPLINLVCLLLGWPFYTYVKGCNICLSFKAVKHKPYGNLQALPVPIHQWKDLSIDFVTGLPVSTNWKSETYDSILVIIDRLTKMVHYEPVKVTIDAPGLVKAILNVVVWHHGLHNSIVSDRGSLFILQFWSLLCYFLGIKRRLSTAFHPQTDGQTER